ncbi:hypothetical protein K440DRAFT_643342 [Wilcoxina mikolae CBS 423.85]|nr:hypothetical protein K440DRAFT_643342 [Wilcoxina mikolae CBS 423.85]
MCRLRQVRCINCHEEEVIVERACANRNTGLRLCDRDTSIIPEIQVHDCGCANRSYLLEQQARHDEILAWRLQEGDWLVDSTELAIADQALAQELQAEENASLEADLLAQELQDAENASLEADLAEIERQQAMADEAMAQALQDAEEASLVEQELAEEFERQLQLETDAALARALADDAPQNLAMHPPPPVHQPVVAQPPPQNAVVIQPIVPQVHHVPPPLPPPIHDLPRQPWDPEPYVAHQREQERRGH